MKQHFRFHISGILIILAAWSNFAFAKSDTDPYKLERARFLQAEQFLEQKQRQKFWDALHQLHEYPLYPYLRYRDLLSRINTATESEVLTFVMAYSDSPLVGRLQYQWLASLARKKDWDRFTRYYRKTADTHLQCWYHQSLISRKRVQESIAQMDTIWLQGSSLPENCDPVLQQWKSAGAITEDKIRERMILAAENLNFRLARYLAKDLGKEERNWIQIWHKAHIQPATAEKLKWTQKDDRYVRTIALHAAKKLIRLNPEDGEKLWRNLQQKIPFTPKELASLNRYKALSYAKQYHPDALTQLEQIPANHEDDIIREWKIRISLYRNDWDGVIQGYEKLTPAQKSEYRWLYWKARALLEKGNREDAGKILKRLAHTRSYEGFLSADILDKQYHFHHKPIQTSNADINRIVLHPNILRARELFLLERYSDARREWQWAIRNMQQQDLVDAAWLAHSWGWQDQAINTLARAGIWNDLEIRFPLAYYDEVQKYSSTYGISPAWALAMIKQESSFTPDARSRSNARGLMQLMPSTARYIAGKINIRLQDVALLYKTQFNIKLGMAYLTYIKDYYQGHTVLATAAYNAGKGRVDKWIPKDRTISADIWIETIPYRETRNYTRNVLAFMAVYENRMGRKTRPLQHYMPDIKPKKDEQADTGARTGSMGSS